MTTALTATIDYAALVTPEQVQQTADAVRARNIKVQVVNTAAEAHDTVAALIPAGATIMTGASKTLQDIGFEKRLINKAHNWVNLKDEMMAEEDQAKQMEMRFKSILSPYFLGSVQAVAQTGEIVIASASGSQLAPYAFSSQNVIWVAGAQKIVPTLDAALRRVREYSFPKENERMQEQRGMNSMLAKILIIEHEPAMMGRNVNLILVNEPVGV